jgi:hypothetical protein
LLSGRRQVNLSFGGKETGEGRSVPLRPLPRDYRREPTILDPPTVHTLVRELLDYANANRTWGIEVAEALADLVVTRLSDTHSSLDPALAREVFDGIRANWSTEPLAYVDALCTVLVNMEGTRPFLEGKFVAEQSPDVRALLAEALADSDGRLADAAPGG